MRSGCSQPHWGDVLMPPCFFTISALGHLRMWPVLREFCCNTLSCQFLPSAQAGIRICPKESPLSFYSFTLIHHGKRFTYEECCRLWTTSCSVAHLQPPLICKKRLTCIQEGNLVLFLLLDLHDLILLRNSFWLLDACYYHQKSLLLFVGRGRL